MSGREKTRYPLRGARQWVGEKAKRTGQEKGLIKKGVKSGAGRSRSLNLHLASSSIR